MIGNHILLIRYIELHCIKQLLLGTKHKAVHKLMFTCTLLQQGYVWGIHTYVANMSPWIKIKQKKNSQVYIDHALLEYVSLLKKSTQELRGVVWWWLLHVYVFLYMGWDRYTLNFLYSQAPLVWQNYSGKVSPDTFLYGEIFLQHCC